MLNNTIKIFIGYDPVETIAWHTLVQSIIEKSSVPVAIIPINLNNLKGIYKRKKDNKQSNEFSFSRFLVPFLCDYEGFGIFFDCDMMIRTDIAEILNEIQPDENKAVYVVKHDYTPRDSVKYLNKVQYNYPKKNWSSVVLWNAGHDSNRIVTPEFVNEAKPEILHRFEWLNDSEIGDLNIRWNWLVGEYDAPPADVKNVHWTIGGPYFKEYQNTDFSDEWNQLKEKINYCKQRDEL